MPTLVMLTSSLTETSPAYSYAGAGAARRPPTRRCAYVAVVWGGDRYVPGALVVAGSLRRVGARHDLVCMVTPDVTETSLTRLRLVYDHVVSAELISCQSRKFGASRQGQLYNHWLDTSFTKWNALRLTGYSRVLVVDTDMTFLTNCDELFELAPPAACFSMPWAEPYSAETRNYFLGGGRGALAHGDTVPAVDILAALDSPRPSFVGCTWTTLLEPSLARLKELAELINRGPVYAEGRACVNTPDEISLAETYASRGVSFRHISPKYAAIPWHPAWVSADCRAIHYHGGEKPWEMARGDWPDLAQWWVVADALTAKWPGIMGPPPPSRAPPRGGTGLQPRTAPPDPFCGRGSLLFGELEVTRRLRAHILATSPGPQEKTQREANNILERWAIALANAGARPFPFWGTALLSEGDAANRQFVRELAELDQFRRQTAQPVRAPEAILAAAKTAIREAMSAARGRVPPDAPPPVFQYDGGQLTYSGRRLARGVPTDRLSLLIEMGGLASVGEMALSYEALAPGGCQWRFPREHADYLYEVLGVRHEGFASPLNSNFIGREGATYYSLFPEIDRPFGSSGSFFGADMGGGGWLINPPFIENILERAALQVQAALSARPAAPLTVFFVMPAWVDSSAYRILRSSPDLVAAVDLIPGEYYYETPSGAKVFTSAPSKYFALSSAREVSRSSMMAAHLAHVGSGAVPKAGHGPPKGHEAISAASRSVRPALDDGSPGWAPPVGVGRKWPELVPPPRSIHAHAQVQGSSRQSLWPERDGYIS